VDRDFCIVQVELKGGARLETRVGAPRGTPENPLSSAMLAKKFTECAVRVLPAPRVHAILERLERLEREVDLRPLVAQLASV
jgi:2-methylcitrate dehydratase PrpD